MVGLDRDQSGLCVYLHLHEDGIALYVSVGALSPMDNGRDRGHGRICRIVATGSSAGPTLHSIYVQGN